MGDEQAFSFLRLCAGDDLLRRLAVAEYAMLCVSVRGEQMGRMRTDFVSVVISNPHLSLKGGGVASGVVSFNGKKKFEAPDSVNF